MIHLARRIWEQIARDDLSTLTSSERYLLECVSRVIKPAYGDVDDFALQAHGRLDPEAIREMLAQARSYVAGLDDSAFTYPIGNGKDLPLEKKTELVLGIIRAAQKADRGRNVAVEVAVSPKPAPDGLPKQAECTSELETLKSDITFFPAAFELSLPYLVGVANHEYLHSRHFVDAELSRKETKIRTSQIAPDRRSIHGPLPPLYRAAGGALSALAVQHSHRSRWYPVDLQPEREGWMLQIATTIMAIHDPRFAAHIDLSLPEHAVFA